MRIDSVPFWANLFLYFFESKYIQQIILVKYLRSYEYHDRSRFKDDLWTVNDSVEFCSSFKNMYPKELDTKRGTSRETYEQFRYYHGVWHHCLLTSLQKEMNYHFPLFACSTHPSKFHHQFFMLFSKLLWLVRWTLRLTELIPFTSEL